MTRARGLAPSDPLATGGRRRGRIPRWGLAGLGVALGSAAACANLIGITDTPVAAEAGPTPDSGGDVAQQGGSDSSLATDSVMAATADAADGTTSEEVGSVTSASGADAERDVTAADASASGDGSAVADAHRVDGGERDEAGHPLADASAPTEASVPTDASMADSHADASGCALPCPVNRPICESGQCLVRGPALVPVSSFYIEATEVTVADYQAFLGAKGTDTSGQPSVCSWNKSYYDTSIPMNPGAWPITNVDWCDALAYCTWAGEHLCGKIGGGPIALADVFTPNLSQWFLSCGGPGGSTHPNSNPVCNSSGGFGNLAPVGSYAMCGGFYPGIFDLEGNAGEWVDSCDSTDAGATDTCHLLGGSYIDTKSFCTESLDSPRNQTASPIGFRCCGG